jgi:hypothetical protein
LLHKADIIRNDESSKVAADREALATFSNVDFQRTRFWCLCASVSVGYQRRLPDATPRELTFDKKVSRRVCAMYRQLWELYERETEVPAPPEWQNWPIHYIDPMMNRIGASVIWSRQIDYLVDVVINRMNLLGQYRDLAVFDGMRTWYNKHDTLLGWEVSQLERISEYQKTKRPTR